MIQTVADFKRKMVKGAKVNTIYHRESVGRDQNGVLQYKSVQKPVREVSIVQSNSFALKTPKTDGTFSDSWCNWPKKNDCTFEGGKVTISEQGVPILTYWFEV